MQWEGELGAPSVAPPFCVRPRVRERAYPDSAPLLAEDVLRPLLERGARGLVWIGGPPGSGKSTALAYLGRLLGPGLRIEDGSEGCATEPGELVVYAAVQRRAA